MTWSEYRLVRTHALAIRAGVVVVALACAVLVAACGGGGSSSSTPSAASLLSAAEKQFNATSAFHFTLQTTNPGTAPNSTSFYPVQADGDIVRPNGLSASVTIATGLGQLSTQVIATGGKGWYLNPLTNQYAQSSDVANLSQLFDAKSGLGTLLPQISGTSAPSDRTVGGQNCWYISGKLAASAVTSVFNEGGNPTSPLPVDVCIAKQSNQLIYVSLAGPIIAGDLSNTTHSISLSKFGESVTIQPPPGA